MRRGANKALEARRRHRRRPASPTRSHARILPHNRANEDCTARKRRLHEDQAMRSACGGNAGRSCATSPVRHTTPVMGGLAWCLGQHRQQARPLRSSGRKRRTRWWISTTATEKNSAAIARKLDAKDLFAKRLRSMEEKLHHLPRRIRGAVHSRSLNMWWLCSPPAPPIQC